MGVSVLTAINIATNYPDNIMIAAGIDEGLKWAGYVYLMRGTSIHSMVLSSTHDFETAQEAEDKMREICAELVSWYQLEYNTTG